MYRFWQEGRRRVAWLNQQTQGGLDVIFTASKLVLSPECVMTAAAIAYFALFSLFPLTLLTVAVASLWFADPLLAENEIVTQLEFVAPALGSLLGANIEQIVRSRSSVSGFAALALLWASSSIFHVLTRALDSIWSVDRRRPLWRHRGLALLTALLISTVLLLASVVGSTIITILSRSLPDGVINIYSRTSQLPAALLNMVLFAVLYYFLPHKQLAWRDVLPGAFIAGLLWEGAKSAFLYFVTNYLSLSNLIYGSVATLTAFLTWAYVSSLIFLFGAYLNVGYYRLRERRIVGAAPK